MIKINGITIEGNNYGSIDIVGGRIIIDGKEITLEKDTKVFNIEIHGDMKSIKVDTCAKFIMSGNAGSVSTVSGDLNISGNVQGSVSTVSGDVHCGDVGGNVSTVSGDIK